MRTKNLLFALLLCSFVWTTVKAETEPNDTKITANTLLLNSSNSGAIGAAADEDWWSLATTSDGKLDVLVTSFTVVHTKLQSSNAKSKFLVRIVVNFKIKKKI